MNFNHNLFSRNDIIFFFVVPSLTSFFGFKFKHNEINGEKKIWMVDKAFFFFFDRREREAQFSQFGKFVPPD